MRFRNLVVGLLFAVSALWLSEPSRGEAPASSPPAAAPAPAPAAAAAPVPATPAPAAPAPAAPAPVAPAPAAPAKGPEAAAKGPPVIIESLPPVSGVFGGKVEFAEKAFPILGEHKDTAVQAAIRNVKAVPCPMRRGAGKISKRELVKAPPEVTGAPIWQTWQEECPKCGGFKDFYDVRIGSQLLEVVDRLGHVPRDSKFDDLRTAAATCLAMAGEVRDKELTTYRCMPVVTLGSRSRRDSDGDAYTTVTRTLTGATVEPAGKVPFHAEVAPTVEPLWGRLGFQAPVGQAVLIIGTTSEMTEAGGWAWMRMRPSGKGPEAILLCGTQQTNVVPTGRIVLGGLLVGRWIPDGLAPPPSAPVAGTKPPPPLTAGLLQPGMLPVVLAVVATEPPKAADSAQPSPAGKVPVGVPSKPGSPPTGFR